jgi:hypothetical protein
MATYSATIQLSNGTLTVTRPHPSVEDVDDVIDSLLYNVRDEDNTITSIGITVVTLDTGQAAPLDPATLAGQLTTDGIDGAHADPTDLPPARP